MPKDATWKSAIMAGVKQKKGALKALASRAVAEAFAAAK